ncbi:MAG TPA: TolC family protein [bacterium]|nr:TolC family protein [bacterium]
MRAMTIKTAAFMLLLLLAVMTKIYPQQHAATWDLEQLIEEALQNNPAYRSAVYQAQQVNQTISQAGALPDPILGLSVMNLPVDNFAFDLEPMTGKKLSLMQVFPFPGKLKLKENMAGYQAQVVEQQVEELKNDLIKNVKLMYYEIFYLDKSIEILNINQTLLQQLVTVAEKKYSVGKGLQQDVLKARVEHAKISDKLISLQQKRKNAVFKLNKLLNRNISQSFEKIKIVDKPAIDYYSSDLKALGLEHRPILKTWRLLIEKSKSGNKLAKLDYLPDFRVGIAYTQRDDLRSGMKIPDFFSAELQLDLPLYFYKKQSKKVQETQLKIRSLEDSYIAIKNEVFFEIENAITEIEKNTRLIELYKTNILPQASQSLNSAMSGYQFDKVDFLTLLNNQLTLYGYELEHYFVFTALLKNFAELEAAVGISLENNF